LSDFAQHKGLPVAGPLILGCLPSTFAKPLAAIVIARRAASREQQAAHCQGDFMSRVFLILTLLLPLPGCATMALSTLATGAVVGAAGVAIATGGVGNPF
jgi:tagatose-1,6-bisphosphate aldolase non-catalytic subunit AgaZ/GatZ